MKHKEHYDKNILTLLAGLKRQYPLKPLSIHIYAALAEYNGEFWGLEDKDLFESLDKYSRELSMYEDGQDIIDIYQDEVYSEDEEEEEFYGS